MGQHTPGPWAIRAVANSGQPIQIVGTYGVRDGIDAEPILAAIVPECDGVWSREDKANAHLIAEAPALADALRDVTRLAPSADEMRLLAVRIAGSDRQLINEFMERFEQLDAARQSAATILERIDGLVFA